MGSEKQIVRMEIFEERIIFPEYTKDGCRSYEDLYEETFEFAEGKMYGILGESGEGGGGISWLLSGREVLRSEQVTVFGKEYQRGESIEEGWCLSEGIPDMNKPAGKQIAAALKRSGSGLTVQDIIDKFQLSEEQLHLKIQNYGWEVWRVSAAIGYALGKKIFCFPPLPVFMVKEIVLQSGFFIYVEKLCREGCILILPCSSREILEAIADVVIELNNPRFKDLSVFHELVRSYKEGKLFYQWAIDD